jgi:hypothetical protein
MASIDFRYLIPEAIFVELTQLSKEGHKDKNRIVAQDIILEKNFF